MSRTIAASVGVLLAALSTAVQADYGGSGLVSQVEARRYGLERAWFTQVSLDSSRGRISDFTYFVSATQKHTVYEVRYEGRKQTFSERDTDRFGDVLGKEAAEKEAKAFVEELKLREIEAKIEKIEVPEITLYVVTDRAVLHAIDAETGRTRWTTVVGNRTYPTERPGVNEDYVAVLNGSTVHLLRRDTGEMAWIRAVDGAASAGPALTDQYVVVPTFTGNVEWYEIGETRTLPKISRSNGHVLIQPTVTPFSVMWPTDRGLLYVARTTQAMRYRMEARKAIVSQAAYASPGKVLAASIDGSVYCLHETSGDELWRFSAGEPISNSPVPVGDSTYIVTDKGSMFCLDLEKGTEKWSAPQVRRLVSVSKDRLYCLGVTGRLAILDAKTGGRIAQTGTEAVGFSFYANAKTDRIIAATATGLIQCLHETELQWPLVHLNLAEAEQQRRPEIKQEGLEGTPAKPVAKPAAPAAPAKGADPFGGGAPPAAGGADPFGAGGAAPKPAAGDQGGADPFGAGGAAPKPAAGGQGGADPFGAGGAAPKPAAGGQGGAKDDPFN